MSSILRGRAYQHRRALGRVLVAVLALLAVALPVPAAASAIAPSGLKTRVWGFDVPVPPRAWAEAPVSRGPPQGYDDGAAELAVDSPVPPSSGPSRRFNLLREGAEVDGPYILFNKTHTGARPTPRGRGPGGGRLQSHHGLQGEWADANLDAAGYKRGLAPTVTVETGSGFPHTTMSNGQNLRRDLRVGSGQGKWSSGIDAELQNTVNEVRQWECSTVRDRTGSPTAADGAGFAIEWASVQDRSVV